MSICDEIILDFHKLNADKFELVKAFVEGVLIGQGTVSKSESHSATTVVCGEQETTSNAKS